MWTLWVALAASCLTTIARAQIRILAPESLKRGFEDVHQVIVGSTSTFGAPFYGERVTGRLRQGYSHGQHHCTADDYDIIDLSAGHDTKFRGARVVDIVVVRVGGCSPVTKVKVAQRKDVHAVLFVDDSDKSEKDIQDIILPDDGEGDTVTIPSILVSRRQGEMLFDAMRNDLVVVELSWDIPQSPVVTVDFWFSSGSMEANNFLKGFREAAEALSKRMKFVPHYDVFDLPAGGDYGGLCSDIKDSSGVKHCAPDPDGPGPVTGADVANEDVRQICLYKMTQKIDEKYEYAPFQAIAFSAEWWEYVTKIHDMCPLQSHIPGMRFGSETCSIAVMKGMKIPVDYVETCFSNKAGKYLEKAAEEHAWSEMALRINGWRYRGPLDPMTVLKAVCSGYTDVPLECNDLIRGVLGNLGRAFLGQSAVLSKKTFAFLMIAIVLTSIANCFVYRRYISKLIRRQMREEVMLEVQQQMADYSKLEER